MITVYGVSKPEEGSFQVINPLCDTRICLCPDKDMVTFAESICKAMARMFPGELYYCWDSEPAIPIVTYTFLVNEAENKDKRKIYLRGEDLLARMAQR
jgi:hypothetical protein